MQEFFRAVFDKYVVPYVYSVQDAPQDSWLPVLFDLSIAAAHAAMVVVLVQVMLKRQDPLFRRVMLVFVLFLGFRGLSQLLSLWTIWNTKYQLGAGMRTVSVILSVVTAVVLVWLLPVLHRLPSAEQLRREIEERRVADEAIREKDERFRSFVENVQDYAMFMIDREGIVQSWNQGAQRIKRYGAEEIVGQHFSCFYTVEDREGGVPEEAIRTACESGRYVREGWRLRKDGSRFWASVVLRPLYGANGELRGFSKITRDLTESRELESRYQTLVDSAPDAIVILAGDSKIQYFNARAEKVFGYRRAEVLGKAVEMLVPLHARESQAAYMGSLFEETAHPLPSAPPEILGIRKDGTEFPLEFSVSRMETREGRLLQFALRDLTERQRAEARFRTLLEAAPDAIFITGRTGRIVYMNRRAEEIFGFKRAELLGKPSEVLIPERLRLERGQERERFFASPAEFARGYGGEYLCLRGDGSEFLVEASRSPLETEEGPVMLTSVRDITERKLVAAQLAEKMTELRHSNQALEQFAHIASHDLQEPLRMVASYTQLLSRRYKGKLDGDADEFIEYAVDGTRRMKRLIEDLLLYSRAGKGAPPVSEFASEAALCEALNNLHATIQESHALVTYDALPKVVAASSQMVQVFQNLIGNAIKYRGDRVPEIHVSAEVAEREWIFAVSDNGIGIEPRFYERVFEIFQRLHGRGEYEGTGIGLAICKRILQQQGGRIWVESEVGRGSVFHFAMPVR
jgi:PAS domain S-box-containing protein